VVGLIGIEVLIYTNTDSSFLRGWIDLTIRPLTAITLLLAAWTVIQFGSRAFDSLAGDRALKNINVRAKEYKKLLDSGVINEIEYEDNSDICSGEQPG
jgi:hypothetical protein